MALAAHLPWRDERPQPRPGECMPAGDPLLLRFAVLHQQTRRSRQDEREYQQLLNRLYSRWRWRTATRQAQMKRHGSQPSSNA